VYPALAAAHPPRGLDGKVLIYCTAVAQVSILSRPISLHISNSALSHGHQTMVTAFTRVRCATTLAPMLWPGCQLHMSESCRQSSALSKVLSTASAGHWAGKCEQGKQGTWRSILDAMGAAQGSATSKSKQGSVRRV
jgi:hypothetical protein